MAYKYSLHPDIDLFVKGRISKSDAERQKRTAKAILSRFEDQPGIILADEVGMGKTFVALAVAASVALQNHHKQPVVVMVPGSLQKKWPRDFSLFKEKCYRGTQRLECGVATRAIDFLKLLDDPPSRQKQIIFLTHGAMSRGLNDSWVKLAIIKRALSRRKDAEDLKRALYRFMGQLLNLGWAEKRNEDIWKVLLNTSTNRWLKELQGMGVDPENDNKKNTDDDPVPKAVEEVMNSLSSKKFDAIYNALTQIPRRQSKNFNDNLKQAKIEINLAIKEIWKKCLKSLDLSVPLLILDEAHHLKNAQTTLASLFRAEDAAADAEEISKGPLAGAFERMLFLTATPFQLGHHELCSVLDRFKAIKWEGPNAPQQGYEGYSAMLDTLKEKLDECQRDAIRLEEAWSKLTLNDLIIKDRHYTDVNVWWEDILKEPAGQDVRMLEIFSRYEATSKSLKSAVKYLKKLLIRHTKPKELEGQFRGRYRRKIFNGVGILDETNDIAEKGIVVQGEALLPFLLAARASVKDMNKRPLFAEGLASSFEAFMKTRLENIRKQLDSDDELEEEINLRNDWHYQQLGKLLSTHHSLSPKNDHPKIKATVAKAIDLWQDGEKVLIFCHFVATGKALRQYISEEMSRSIIKMGARKIGCEDLEVMQRLDNIGQRFAKDGSSLRNSIQKEIERILSPYENLKSYSGDLETVILRYVRTPSFLVRFFPLNEKQFSGKTFKEALKRKDKSGLSLRQIIVNFFEFLATKCSEEERSEYIKALSKIQTGSIAGEDVQASYTEDEVQGDQKEKLVPNVRLVNGSTLQESRQNLMLTFNTPFYPDILIASSVMAEGVDLHLNCRYIIHHDLCWNPSNLEQRTGRVDRIGAKVERCGEPICIYLPYISETQDEKMFKVVMDRERWFKIIMGEKSPVDLKTTDKIAERIALPESIIEELSFKLGV